jgi:hypothetical protein
MKPARTKSSLGEKLAFAGIVVAMVSAAALRFLFDLSSMSLWDFVLTVIFVLMIVSSAVSSFLVGFLVLWAMWKGIFMILSYKGPKRGQ